MGELNKRACRAYTNAVLRKKTSIYNSHQTDVEGLMAEMKEFAEASETKDSGHLPLYTEAEEELADILICCMTELFKRGVNVDNIVDAKMEFNEKRAEKSDNNTKKARIEPEMNPGLEVGEKALVVDANSMKRIKRGDIVTVMWSRRAFVKDGYVMGVKTEKGVRVVLKGHLQKWVRYTEDKE